jgi:signal transduction histidine kinase
MDAAEPAPEEETAAPVAPSAPAAQPPMEDSHAMVSFVLAALAHDLRSPLTSILAMSQLLSARLRQHAELERETLIDDLHLVERAAKRLQRMVEELQDLAETEHGRALELRRVPTDLVALARACAEEFQGTSPAHALAVEAAEEAIHGAWDGGRLERVLANLLSNAIKYSPDGGRVTVGVATEQGEAGGAGWARVSVQDGGIGIPAAEHSTIFERFRRGSNVPAQVRGAGIGLAGAKQIVEQHGGTLRVESEEGKGARFTVRLPLPLEESDEE